MAVQASYHQGNDRFKGRGRQCGVNSAVAIQYLYRNYSPKNWTTDTLNQILYEGDALYISVSEKLHSEFLSLEDISRGVEKLSPSLHGSLARTKTEEPFYALEDALSCLMVEQRSACIINIGQCIPAYSLSILKDENLFYVFDPHSRNEVGMMSSDGAATMTTHKDIPAVKLFFQHLAASLKFNQTPFEVAKLSNSLASDKPGNFESDTDSEFSGFSEVSEGEYTCKLYIQENRSDSESDLISDVSSINEIAFLDSVIQDSDIENLDESDLFLNNINLDILEEAINNDNVHDPDPDYCEKVEDDNQDDDDDDDDDEVKDPDYDDDDDYDDDVKDPDYVDDDDDDDDKDDDEDDVPLIRLRTKSRMHANKHGKDSFIEGRSDVEMRESEVGIRGDGGSKTGTGYERESEVGIRGDRGSEEEMGGAANSEMGMRGDRVSKTGMSRPSSEMQCEVDEEDGNRPKRGRGRKRLRNESAWKRNIAKQRRNEGKEYVTESGKRRNARVMKPGCGHKCRFKCHQNISQKERESIFHAFWKSGDSVSKWQFIGRYAHLKPKKTKKCGSKVRNRKNSIIWTLPCKGNTSQKVCKTFFLATLGISEMMIRTAHKKHSYGICDKDERGGHSNRKNKVPESVKETVRSHIESFQCIDSHYCRKDSKKDYLPPGLTVAKMYSLYEKKCQELGEEPASGRMYRKVFDNEYNIAFNKPLKDKCNFCISFKNFPEEIKIQRQEDYEKHIWNKEKAREHKKRDKQAAEVDKELTVACFDLEEVLLTPHSTANAMYYKRRLCTYNFTVYEYGTKDGYSYIWNESIAGRGACEIASCLYDYIKMKSSEGKTKYIFYSDNCGSQNKNKFHVSMLWFCLQKFGLQSIEHKFLEKGHTFNEADSIHSAVDRASENIDVFTTPQWAATVRMARREQAYKVKEMSLENFFDFRAIAGVLKNFSVTTEKDKVNWFGLKTIKLHISNPNIFKYQSVYEGEELFVNLCGFTRSRDIPRPETMTLQQLRKEHIPINRDKYRDLISLCADYLIERVHHGFFLLLPHE